jgi:hypothetical protein
MNNAVNDNQTMASLWMLLVLSKAWNRQSAESIKTDNRRVTTESPIYLIINCLQNLRLTILIDNEADRRIVTLHIL